MISIKHEKFSEAHFKALKSWFRDERALVQWGGPGLHHPLDDDQLASMLAETSGTKPARWARSAIVSGVCAGHTQMSLDWANGIGRLARVGVSPEHRRQGIGRSMLQEVIKSAFRDGDIERLELNVFSWNTAAISTYKHLGFIAEGTRRSSVRVGIERWDTDIMGLLRSEWVAI